MEAQTMHMDIGEKNVIMAWLQPSIVDNSTTKGDGDQDAWVVRNIIRF